jgi:hypothetical protein
MMFIISGSILQVTFVMAYLNGNDIPDFFRPSTLFTKIFGTICTVSSGLPIGQEGPLVHIGAAIASSLTWMYGRVPLRTKEGTSSRSPRDCWEWLSGILPQNWPFVCISAPCSSPSLPLPLGTNFKVIKLYKDVRHNKRSRVLHIVH